MPRKKKPFINKKDPRTHTFSLVHRSQRDPLAADPDANQLVLAPTLPANSANVDPKIPLDVDGELLFNDYANRAPQQEKFNKKAELADAGILFTDDYNYEQHLKVRAPEDDSNVYKVDPKAMAKVLEEKGLDPDAEIPALVIPGDMFGSAFEEDVGLLNRAAPYSGPRLDWDPEVVAAMDDDFDFDDSNNQLLDNFMDMALADELPEGAEYANDSDGDWTDDDGAGSLDSLPDQFGEMRMMNLETETVKSRFTEYSMSSSVLPRNDNLEFRDRHFEKLFEQYDEEEIGALDEQEGEEAVAGNASIDDFAGVLDEFLEGLHKEHLPSGIAPKGAAQVIEMEAERSAENKAKAADLTLSVLEKLEQGTGPAVVNMTTGLDVAEYPEKKERDFDCETILTTRSTLYNHPRRIVELANKIRLNPKSGLPIDMKYAKPDRGQIAEEDDSADSEEEPEPENLGVKRSKGETPAEKKARKQAIKNEKKSRRQEKKATKTAFRDEENRQKKVASANPMAGHKIKTLS